MLGAPFPLTAALSLREREIGWQVWCSKDGLGVTRGGERGSLSLRERAGVRGNGASENPPPIDRRDNRSCRDSHSRLTNLTSSLRCPPKSSMSPFHTRCARFPDACPAPQTPDDGRAANSAPQPPVPRSGSASSPD